MKENNKIEELKKEYNSIEIPEELDFVVEKAIQRGKEEMEKSNNKSHFLSYKRLGFSVASVFIIFAAGVNINSTFAKNMEEIPVINTVARLVNYRTYVVKDKGFNADIKVSQVQGLENEVLEKELNEKFIKQGQEEYKSFLKEMESIKAQGENGKLSVVTDYEVKTDNDSVFSVVYKRYETNASSDLKYKSYTVDKKNKAIVSLEGLFKDNSYVDAISNYIKEDMKRQMQLDEGKVYFINEEELGDENFDKIDKEQSFYINAKGKLVILFDKYEVAPGYMGAMEFEIPTEAIKGILLERGLIK